MKLLNIVMATHILLLTGKLIRSKLFFLLHLNPLTRFLRYVMLDMSSYNIK